jgi:2-polyprenyl-3-methyl-5-hydroxy-6-metoxy-1,4-benzoquinol methylase
MQSEHFDDAKVLRKYLVKYYRCTSCGFLQTETPYWLEEAYSSAISKLDTGILARNLSNQSITTAILNLLLPDAKTFLDYGAGHGIFVRLMRDKGFDFSWYDLHATNDYARGFEHVEGDTYDFLTSFEVLEHLVDPVAELSAMMSRSSNVFVSTFLLPRPTPKVADWWYYSPISGQHISFYTLDALHLLARRFNRHLLSHGAHHLFAAAPKSKLLFRLAISQRASHVLNRLRRRRSLTESDLEAMSKQDAEVNHGRNSRVS